MLQCDNDQPVLQYINVLITKLYVLLWSKWDVGMAQESVVF